ncbi:hypothetical protein BDP27DRAFT_1375903 [Rhodocollybia butyracea]|uniref:Uncharacterized protein n=1 Tax=Rhodocollybia butyracea TaxID=206335 RepID=A0A9P5P6Q1_9AGAR|nr:hypothetical protein BDP27DRAFT_1375903 [Rhodocollybia butyracea]
MPKSSSKLKSHRVSGSRRVQQYGGGSTNLVELMKSTIHTVNRMQITNLKAKQEALKSNEEFWEQRQVWDGTGFSDNADEDMDRVADVLEGWNTMDHSNAGEWEDIAGEFWQTEAGKSQVEPMARAYMTWHGALGKEGIGGGIPGEFDGEINSQTVIAVDLFPLKNKMPSGRVALFETACSLAPLVSPLWGSPHKLLSGPTARREIKGVHRYPESRGDYYLTREEVDKWSKESIKEMYGGQAEEKEVNPCAERWKNLSEELTAKMWGAKYPLSILTAFLMSLERISVLAMILDVPLAQRREQSTGRKGKKPLIRFLVGAFHGHAHSQLCQTCYLCTYIKGLGIEHLEESSPGNPSHPPALAKTMNDLGIPSTDTFDQWLKDERDYLSGLKKEPAEELLQMEYYKKLVKLGDAE